METLPTKEDAPSNSKLMVSAGYDSPQEPGSFEVPGAEVKKIFDMIIKGQDEERGGHYLRVGVLFLSWLDDDRGCDVGKVCGYSAALVHERPVVISYTN